MSFVNAKKCGEISANIWGNIMIFSLNCNFCGKIFTGLALFEKHIKVVHKDLFAKIKKKEKCVANISRLKGELKNSLEVKNYICETKGDEEVEEDKKEFTLYTENLNDTHQIEVKKNTFVISTDENDDFKGFDDSETKSDIDIDEEIVLDKKEFILKSEKINDMIHVEVTYSNTDITEDDIDSGDNSNNFDNDKNLSDHNEETEEEMGKYILDSENFNINDHIEVTNSSSYDSIDEENDFEEFVDNHKNKSITSFSNFNIAEVKSLNDSMKKYQCHICNQKLKNAGTLRDHLRRHGTKKQHKCNYCSKEFFTSNEKNTHERIHTGEKKYVCEFCGLTYTSSAQLSTHKQTHNQDRNYKCKICSKSFFTTQVLRAHIKTHNTVRNQVCKKCGKSYRTIKTLRAHEKIHLDEKKFSCVICNKKFAQQAGWASHLKTHNLSK